MRPVGYRLPTSIFRYVVAVSWPHQIALVMLTVVTFLLEVVPLEIQRRVVNDLVKERSFGVVVTLCAAYAGFVLVQGATKLGLNVYRGWVGENAIRDLRRHVLAYLRIARAAAPGPEARGVAAAMIVGEVEPIGGFVGGSVSEPLLQTGILLSVLGYIVHIDRWMAAAAFALFVPQLIFVPLMQGAIKPPRRRARVDFETARRKRSRYACSIGRTRHVRRQTDRPGTAAQYGDLQAQIFDELPDEHLQPSSSRSGTADRRLSEDLAPFRDEAAAPRRPIGGVAAGDRGAERSH